MSKPCLAAFFLVLLLGCGIVGAEEPASQAPAAADPVYNKPIRKGIPTPFSQRTRAVSSDKIPDILLSGLSAYQSDGPEAAIRNWVKGGPIDGETAVLKSSPLFNRVEQFYGPYLGYELIHVEDITPSSRLVYLQMNYEKGPLFTRFLCYEARSSWIVAGQLIFDTDPQKVLPELLSSN